MVTTNTTGGNMTASVTNSTLATSNTTVITEAVPPAPYYTPGKNLAGPLTGLFLGLLVGLGPLLALYLWMRKHKPKRAPEPGMAVRYPGDSNSLDSFDEWDDSWDDSSKNSSNPKISTLQETKQKEGVVEATPQKRVSNDRYISRPISSTKQTSTKTANDRKPKTQSLNLDNGRRSYHKKQAIPDEEHIYDTVADMHIPDREYVNVHVYTPKTLAKEKGTQNRNRSATNSSDDGLGDSGHFYLPRTANKHEYANLVAKRLSSSETKTTRQDSDPKADDPPPMPPKRHSKIAAHTAKIKRAVEQELSVPSKSIPSISVDKSPSVRSADVTMEGQRVKKSHLHGRPKMAERHMRLSEMYSRDSTQIMLNMEVPFDSSLDTSVSVTQHPESKAGDREEGSTTDMGSATDLGSDTDLGSSTDTGSLSDTASETGTDPSTSNLTETSGYNEQTSHQFPLQLEPVYINLSPEDDTDV